MSYSSYGGRGGEAGVSVEVVGQDDVVGGGELAAVVLKPRGPRPQPGLQRDLQWVGRRGTRRSRRAHVGWKVSERCVRVRGGGRHEAGERRVGVGPVRGGPKSVSNFGRSVKRARNLNFI